MGRSVLDILGHRSIVRLPSGQELSIGPLVVEGGGGGDALRVTCINDTRPGHHGSPGLSRQIFTFNIF